MFSFNDNEKKKIGELIRTAKVTTDTGWYEKVLIPKLLANKKVYDEISKATGVPSAFIACVHVQELGSDVGVNKAYLGNGQPWNKKTTIVPKGVGPFSSFVEGGIHAMKRRNLHKIDLWTLERMIFELEGYNGFGYRSKGIKTPYVWGFTNHYTSGYYIADGVFSATKKKAGAGCFTIYKLLIEKDSGWRVGSEGVVGNTVVVEVPKTTEVPFEPPKELTFGDKIVKWFEEFFSKLFGEKPVEKKEPIAIMDPTAGGGLLEQILEKNPNIDARALAKALEWKDNPAITNKKYIAVVNFNLYDWQKRFHLIDMTTLLAEDYLCAHGVNSDANQDNMADSFGNVSGSKKSSLGPMKFAENYVSSKRKTGPKFAFQISRRIDGLLKELNGNVRARAIVLHDAFYVTEARGKAKTVGDSWGCFVLDYEVLKVINPKLEGCLLYAWDDTLG